MCGWGALSPFQTVGSEQHSCWEGWDPRESPFLSEDQRSDAEVRGCNMCPGPRCDSSAFLNSPCAPAGADGCPGWAPCESWPGCCQICLIAFGKRGGRSVPGLCPYTDLAETGCVPGTIEMDTHSVLILWSTPILSLPRPACANLKKKQWTLTYFIVSVLSPQQQKKFDRQEHLAAGTRAV